MSRTRFNVWQNNYLKSVPFTPWKITGLQYFEKTFKYCQQDCLGIIGFLFKSFNWQSGSRYAVLRRRITWYEWLTVIGHFLSQFRITLDRNMWYFPVICEQRGVIVFLTIDLQHLVIFLLGEKIFHILHLSKPAKENSEERKKTNSFQYFFQF